MYGMAYCFFEGRITRDIELREAPDGRKYCYFSIAINPRPYTDRETGQKVERPAEYFNLSANGGTAVTLAKYGKKGSLFCGLTTPKNQKREVVKDGVKTVYRETVFTVEPNKFDIDKDKEEPSGAGGSAYGSDEPAPHQAAAPAESGYQSGSYNYDAPQQEDEDEDDNGLSSSLPF